MRQLISVLDNREVHEALEKLLRTEKPRRTFAPY
jgi:hypothetical protein